MDSFSDLFKKENSGQVVLAILFIVYLISGYKTPDSVANIVDTIYGKIVVVVVALILFSYANPILGVLGFIVAFDLIRKSSMSTGTYALDHYVPTEVKKESNLNAMNQFPYTLEQEVVKKMAPMKVPDDATPSSFSPVLDDTYDAAPIDYMGVV
ncbi:MAG: hypothetical protein EBY20_02200 [Alphaproteobacteria bacterium]|jgi:hypothetical protein|uniref:Uncharacterized protein n=1 Tax=viral metagenome TaxID=1070528 RepID=A0A6C0HRU6_9ZZZZ|nr:hypothetical protein [Alphaproteobacteria bacterium]